MRSPEDDPGHEPGQGDIGGGRYAPAVGHDAQVRGLAERRQGCNHQRSAVALKRGETEIPTLLGGGRSLGRLFSKTMGYYVLSSFLAAFVGLLMVNLIRPGVGANLTGTDQQALPELSTPESPIQLLLDIVPQNVVQAAATEALSGESQPYNLDWLVEEVSVSVNTTAAGGNASLMSIG